MDGSAAAVRKPRSARIVRSERALRDVVSRRARAYADADSELGASRNIWNPSSRGLCSADG